MTSEASDHPGGPSVVQARWPLERVLFALAGSVTLVSAGLALLVSPWFLLLTALVGVNQWLLVVFGACPASWILGHLFSLPSVMHPAPAGSSCPADHLRPLRRHPLPIGPRRGVSSTPRPDREGG
jgi:hypothetical protein